MPELELWGGHECTVNRVGDVFHDQSARTGHADRADDIDRFASLGLHRLRYPALWETVAPISPEARDWERTDERLARIRSTGLKPILGLLHHGSGPRYTNLLDEDFAPLFGAYAAAVAQRYPWVADWTPINEPLTTARFSALYGHWHPHRMDEASFWTALLNQIDATRFAMQAIRAVNPRARLIQTEDLGRTYSTRATAHQCDYDNARRWMTWDLLLGQVTRDHSLWARLDGFGLGDRLQAIADDPCPPDIIGVNHYLTSDRFLDHRLADYPLRHHGGNAFMAFADVEAVRVVQPEPGGLEGALEEAWERYERPLAVTECHNGCTREEQVRWMREAWTTAQDLRTRGVDVRAVTAWALLGSYDWNSLLTRADGHYEPGAFDVRSSPPRPTVLAAELRRLAGGPETLHPGTAGAGWWRRDIRLAFRPVIRSPETPEPRSAWRSPIASDQPLLITGATGTLGRALARACEWRGIAYRLTGRDELSLDDPDSIERRLEELQPWAVINAAGWVRVDDAEAAAAACMAANAEGAVRLATACAARGLAFVGFSSDLVFDGRWPLPYVESIRPAPLNVYGASKAAAERGVLAANPQALMIRTAAFFSPYDPHNFAAHLRRTLCQDQVFEAADDLVVSPTYVPDLADAVLDLTLDGERGIRHLANDGAVSWADFARLLAEALGLDPGLVRGVPAARFEWAAVRPQYAALGTERGRVMPDIAHAIARHAAIIREAELGSEGAADGLVPDLFRPAGVP